MFEVMLNMINYGIKMDRKLRNRILTLIYGFVMDGLLIINILDRRKSLSDRW